MGTITVNVNSETEKNFRTKVQQFYGRKKGTLGKALSEAMQEWVSRKTSLERCMELLKKGSPMGKITYKKREELHDRH